jgi:hypothetical protein
VVATTLAAHAAPTVIAPAVVLAMVRPRANPVVLVPREAAPRRESAAVPSVRGLWALLCLICMVDVIPAAVAARMAHPVAAAVLVARTAAPVMLQRRRQHSLLRLVEALPASADQKLIHHPLPQAVSHRLAACSRRSPAA